LIVDCNELSTFAAGDYPSLPFKGQGFSSLSVMSELNSDTEVIDAVSEEGF
jgi:hypothetical protein